jgi:hypothetical protein
MARREIVVLEDDIDGSKADETIKFALDGVIFEIDLHMEHATELRGSFAKWTQRARRVGRLNGQAPQVPAQARRTGGRPAYRDKAQNRAIRDWAKRKGYDISDRGVIPERYIDEFNAEAGRGPGAIGNIVPAGPQPSAPPEPVGWAGMTSPV